MNYIENFNLFGVDAQQIPCIKNNGAPTSSTEGAVGCLYMDTSSDSKDIYKCVSAHNGSYTWEKVVNVDKDYVDDAIKEVNGIKYITESVEAHSLDYGVYMIDNNEGGFVTFYDGETQNITDIILGQELYGGVIIVSKDLVYDKMLTCFSTNSSGWAIIFCVGVSDNEYGDADTLSFATTKDLKGDIAFLQAQIDELKNK
jgi:hypothetical protein